MKYRRAVLVGYSAVLACHVGSWSFVWFQAVGDRIGVRGFTVFWYTLLAVIGLLTVLFLIYGLRAFQAIFASSPEADAFVPETRETAPAQAFRNRDMDAMRRGANKVVGVLSALIALMHGSSLLGAYLGDSSSWHLGFCVVVGVATVNSFIVLYLLYWIWRWRLEYDMQLSGGDF